ncbi:rab proteins geranylgeranyltransferase component A 1-like protein [Anopheles sinensis]|uniref:Rab proteins geranylgeranyltransferase component A 1-like protein n=1 Tax=Anopheles sinensis TaxID=74873 RepID=A0A084VW16_ANOSI|nr:rab proteins geranylgeranyltransferase component A 1-like protein [Anopheles sinensis]
MPSVLAFDDRAPVVDGFVRSLTASTGREKMPIDYDSTPAAYTKHWSIERFKRWFRRGGAWHKHSSFNRYSSVD